MPAMYNCIMMMMMMTMKEFSDWWLSWYLANSTHTAAHLFKSHLLHKEPRKYTIATRLQWSLQTEDQLAILSFVGLCEATK